MKWLLIGGLAFWTFTLSGIGVARADSPAVHTSASYRMRTMTPAAGGAQVTSQATPPTIGRLHVLGGQASPIGRSNAPVSGIILEGGFYPAARFVPEPDLLLLLASGIPLVAFFGRRRRVHAGGRAWARVVATLAIPLCLAPLYAEPASAVPTTLNYQGLLTDDLGEPIDGSVNLAFLLYDDEFTGNLLWSETHLAVMVVNGEFTVLLGRFTSLDPVDFDGSVLWMEFIVDGETMAPRQAVSTVPYAFRAAEADRLEGYSAFQLDQSTHALDTDNPHAVTAEQVGAATSAEIATHAGDESAHHGKTSSFAEMTDLVSSAQIPNSIARDAEVVSIVLLSDGAGSTLDADRVDGLSSGSFLRSDGSDSYTSGTLAFGASTAVDLNGTVRVGNDSSTDDDVLLFDSAGTESFGWRNSETRFEITDELAMSGPIRAGNTTGTPVGYNTFGATATPSPSSGDMANAGDVYVLNDIEAGGDIYASGRIFMEGSNGAGQDGDQQLFFYENGARDGESLSWNDFEGRFDFSTHLQVNGWIRSATEFFFGTPKTGHYRIAGAGFRKISESALGSWAVDLNGFGYLGSAATFTNVSAPVNLPHGAVVTSFRCSYSDADPVNAFGYVAYLRRLALSSGNGSIMSETEHVYFNVTDGVVRTPASGTITNATIDNHDYAYWIHVDWDADTAGNWLQRFYGCEIEYEVDRVLP